jgi:hypothetical protein
MSLQQDVEIAEAVLEQYLAAVGHTHSRGELSTRLDQDAAIGAAEQAYPEIWKRLDSARSHAATTGRDVSRYDQIRTSVGANAARAITSTTTTHSLFAGVVGSSKTAEANTDGVRAARDAIDVFRTTFSELPWHTATEIPELRTGRGVAMVIAVIGAVCLVAGYLALRTLA